MAHNLLEEARSIACQKFDDLLNAEYLMRKDQTRESVRAFILAEKEWQEATCDFRSYLDLLERRGDFKRHDSLEPVTM